MLEGFLLRGLKMQKRELERKLSVLYQEQKELFERAQNQISTLGAIISNQNPVPPIIEPITTSSVSAG